jgi:hypothetical protein
MKAHAAVLALSLLACEATARPAGAPEIGADLEPLRSRFDATAGKVRAILLPAPT